MSKIVIHKNVTTIQRLQHLINNLRSIVTDASLLTDKSLLIDLSAIQYITPLSILPIASIITNSLSQRMVKYIYPTDENLKNYLKMILFPEGTQNPNLISYGQTYLPIVRIKIDRNFSNDYQSIIDISIAQYQNIVLNNLVIDQIYKKNITNALAYFIGELSINVQEHSEAKEFWILSQYWDRIGKLEVCILDNGIGFHGCYQKARIDVVDDIDALHKAVTGISAKKLIADSYGERGYGLRTSVNLITQSELKGEFVILSGSAGYYAAHGTAPVYLRIPDYSWQGVIIAAIINKPISQIDISKYIE